MAQHTVYIGEYSVYLEKNAFHIHMYYKGIGKKEKKSLYLPISDVLRSLLRVCFHLLSSPFKLENFLFFFFLSVFSFFRELL